MKGLTTVSSVQLTGSVPVFQLDVLSLVPSLYLDLVEHQEQFILGFHFGQTWAGETF